MRTGNIEPFASKIAEFEWHCSIFVLKNREKNHARLIFPAPRLMNPSGTLPSAFQSLGKGTGQGHARIVSAELPGHGLKVWK
jgi:hypothetical protein